MITDTDYTTGGHNCALCGMYVLHGQYHVCGGAQPTFGPTITYTAPSKDDEIIGLLKRIIELLEAKE